MAKCPFSTMCIICTVVSVISVSILVGLWTFQFLSFANQKRSHTAPSENLSERLLPVSYNVTLRPRLGPSAEGLYIFAGNSSVVFQCVKETDLIRIHAIQLNLTSEATLSMLNGSPAPSITSTQTVSKTQCLTFHLSEKLKAGERYRLHTEFVVELADDLGGFYSGEYDVGGVKQLLVSSRIRHTCGIFPCLDELNTEPVLHITLLQERRTLSFSRGMEINIKH